MFKDAGISDEAEKAGQQAKERIQSVEEQKSAIEIELDEYRRDNPCPKKWAKQALRCGIVDWPEVKTNRAGDGFITVPDNCDRNRSAAFDAIFGTGDFRPYFDLFRGRTIDHTGRVIDENYPFLQVVELLAIVGLKGQSIRSVAETFRHWAREKTHNSLISRMESATPKWDGKERINSYMCDLFHSNKTELNLKFSRYFWLSLYCRVMYPGCQAPIALSLFGTQNAGKSYFGKLLCVEVTGDNNADSIPLDLGSDVNVFLRSITGSSVIANVSEMVGFSRGDLNKIKSFMTRTSDAMDFKYENGLTQSRQWITIMDGNMNIKIPYLGI